MADEENTSPEDLETLREADRELEELDSPALDEKTRKDIADARKEIAATEAMVADRTDEDESREETFPQQDRRDSAPQDQDTTTETEEEDLSWVPQNGDDLDWTPAGTMDGSMPEIKKLEEANIIE